MKKVFVLICMFQDLIDEVYVFQDKKKAEEAFEKYTDQKYSELDEKNWEEFGSTKYGGTQIYDREVMN